MILFWGVEMQAKELSWHSATGYRWTELEVSAGGKTGFTWLASDTTGLVFTNTVSEAEGAANRVLYNGSGVAAGDVDGDGLPDIFLCNLNGQNALFKNLGNWRFKNITAEAGLGVPVPRTRGAVFADINGDGHLDLLITASSRGVLCFLNDGHGKFTDATAAAGTASNLGSTTLALADIDGNGTLDLYVANYRPDDIRDRGRVNMNLVNGRPVLAGTETNRFVLTNGKLEECGQPDQLLLNDGTGRFKPVSWTDGTFLDEDGRKLAETPTDWGLTAAFHDVNGDSAPDLYVCNDYWTPDRFWINDGHGHFRAVAKLALRKTSASSMSVDFADVDRDGNVDFFVVDMLSRDPRLRKREGFAQMPMASPVGALDNRPQVMRNTLFLGRPDGTYAEAAYYANVPGSDWSWAPLFMDVDLDGYPDLLIGPGHFRDVQDYDAEAQVRAKQHPWTGFKNDAERQQAFSRELMEHYHLYPLLQMPVVAFRNGRDTTFEEVTEAWGLNHLGVHQGLAMADFNQDGALDVVVNDLNGPAAILRNQTSAGRIAVRLRGKAPNTQGIGAQVTLRGGAAPHQTSEVICGGHYQSGSDAELMFATGAAASGLSIEVVWRNGSRSVIPQAQRNCLYEIDESGAVMAPTQPAAEPAPFFTDASKELGHIHHEIEYNDYERQPLLPFKLSQLGPGVAWADLDGDGHEDLVIGTGRGGPLSVYRNSGGGKFQPTPAGPKLEVPNDTAGLVVWQESPAISTILTGLTGYEAAGSNAVAAIRLNGGLLSAGPPLAAGMETGGALALGDMNGDGRLCLFVAGGVVPGQYPLGAPSRIYRFDGRQWILDARNSTPLNNIGIVNSALWSDLDGDGLPELVLACEWGPIRVCRNRGGALFEVTEEFGLKAYTGWWRGIAAGDLNNDGKLDLIAANWGNNSPYRASAERPLVFAYGQIAQPGVMEVIETEYVGAALAPRRQFQSMANSLPFLYDRFASHKAYSEATLEEVLGENAPLSRRVEATTLTSMAFINTGKGFQAVPLPRDAQLAPAFAVNVGDFDGDGNEDVFLSQNFFDLQPETPRIDAGLGLWLRGDGAGKLVTVPCAESGVKMYGQQRGAALGDYDEDGRIDLAVAQNGAATCLYHNTRATPGLRVKLKGPAGNPTGIGAVLRLQFGERQSPAREIHAGSGYWSQDSLVQVMASPVPPQKLWVRWPGGRTTLTPIPEGAKEIVVDAEGKLAAQNKR